MSTDDFAISDWAETIAKKLQNQRNYFRVTALNWVGVTFCDSDLYGCIAGHRVSQDTRMETLRNLGLIWWGGLVVKWMQYQQQFEHCVAHEPFACIRGRQWIRGSRRMKHRPKIGRGASCTEWNVFGS